MARMTTGLYILTTGSLEEPYGMVVSWAMPVSYDPPLVAAAVRINRFLHDMIPDFGVFGINVLPKGTEDLLPAFKKAPLKEKFQDLALFSSATGAPLVGTAAAWLDLRLAGSYRPGDHTLYFGQVEAGGVIDESAPMTSLDYRYVYTGKN